MKFDIPLEQVIGKAPRMGINFHIHACKENAPSFLFVTIERDAGEDLTQKLKWNILIARIKIGS